MASDDLEDDLAMQELADEDTDAGAQVERLAAEQDERESEETARAAREGVETHGRGDDDAPDLEWLELQVVSRGIPKRGLDESIDEFRQRVLDEISATETRRRRVRGFRITPGMFANIFGPMPHMIMGDLASDAEMVSIEHRRYERCVVVYMRSIEFEPVEEGNEPPIGDPITIQDYGCPSTLHALLDVAMGEVRSPTDGSDDVDHLKALIRSIVHLAREIHPECPVHKKHIQICEAKCAGNVGSDGSRVVYVCLLPVWHPGPHFDGHAGERF